MLFPAARNILKGKMDGKYNSAIVPHFLKIGNPKQPMTKELFRGLFPKLEINGLNSGYEILGYKFALTRSNTFYSG